MSISINKILAPSPVTIRGQSTQLSSDPKGERIAYASGKSIFLRSIDDPSICKQYTAHTAQTTVARFSPSGFFVASGDVSGAVRVWDAVEAVNTKGEYRLISGRITDIAWDGDSQRLIAVGDGKERFGHCITADSGNSVGEVTGHSKIINAVAIRPMRPMRAITVSDDASTCFLQGPPFKFTSKNSDAHKGFVMGAAFSPDGSTIVSVGADKRIVFYDGKMGEYSKTIEDAHTGSIFAVAWAKDSKRIVTASADQTVKIWDVEAGNAVQTWRFGGESGVSVPDQQVGVTWPNRSDGLIISISLAGDLNYLSEGSSEPVRVVHGHNKTLTAMGVSEASSKTVWTGSFDGRVCSWDIATGEASVVDGSGHTGQITGFTAAETGAYSVGWDDTLRLVDAGACTYTGEASKLEAQPKGVASADGKVYVATASGISVFSGSKPLGNTKTDFAPTAIAASGNIVAVGDETRVRVYKADGSGKLSEITKLTTSTSQISVLAFSGDSKYLAVGNFVGKIVAYNTSDWSVATDRWSAHTARVTCIAWNKEGTNAVSGGLDTHVYVWSLANPGSRVKALNAHKDGVSGVGWVDGKVVSAGMDAAVKVWDVKGLR